MIAEVTAAEFGQHLDKNAALANEISKAIPEHVDRQDVLAAIGIVLGTQADDKQMLDEFILCVTSAARFIFENRIHPANDQ